MKYIALLLCIVMLFSIVPPRAEGASFTKGIDVEFTDLDLMVNVNKISNHKKPFIYEDDIWVSLGDLSKGLKLDMKINKNGSIHLNSNGRLSNNKNLNSFQSGYEILAKERIMAELEDDIRELQGNSPTPKEQMPIYDLKNIRINFGNMRIYLDGKRLDLYAEPIKYKNDIYVAIDSIAPYLYITPTISKDKSSIDIDTNGILIKHGFYTNLNDLISFRSGRNKLLDSQKSQLEKKKEFIEELNLPYRKINNVTLLEKYLNDNLNKLQDISVKFKVKKSLRNISLDISFPVYENSAWLNLRRSEVESWILDVYTVILSLYDEKAILKGNIQNPFYNSSITSSNKDYVTFSSKDYDVFFDFSKSNLTKDKARPDYLVDSLNKRLDKYMNVGLEYKASLNGDYMNLVVSPKSMEFATWSFHTKMGYLQRLKQEIRNIYPDIIVHGEIVFSNSKYEPIAFQISENKVKSIDLMNKTVEELNNFYGFFLYTNGFSTLRYSLSEKEEDNFILVAETSFSINDDSWINSGGSGRTNLDSAIQNAVNFVSSWWNVDVDVEVFDKNMVLIK